MNAERPLAEPPDQPPEIVAKARDDAFARVQAQR
jgi:hypothetical protein